MRKLFFLACVLCAWTAQATTVYTRINNKPSAGWSGTYLVVYEKSATEAYVWNATDASNNFVSVAVNNGQIVSENMADYHVTVSEENTNRYYLHVADGYIGCEAKKNSLTFTNNGKECTLKVNGGYTMLETNTNTCRFLCYESGSNFRFRFYYDQNKQWADNKKHNIYFYVLGEVEQEDPQNQLDLNYAHVEMYACESKFPTQSNPYDQYFMTFMFLAQEESDEAVPQIGLEILAPTQYSIEGTYKSDYTPGQKYFLNCQAGAKHSYFIFPSKAEQDWSEASIKLAQMTVTKVGPSAFANAYRYHIRLVFTDSNQKIWTLDKDMDVYAMWIDCDRSGNQDVNMDPQPFALESGNHSTQTEDLEQITNHQSPITNHQLPITDKFLLDGRLFIIRGGHTYTVTGQQVKDTSK